MQRANALVVQPASTEDAGLLAALRVEAMQPSLEAVGRFDPLRARDRFLNNFCCENTWKLLIEEKLAGFYAFQCRDTALFLDHLYIHPEYQGKGIAGMVINQVKKIAIEKALPIRLLALKESRSNQFYKKHGFQQVSEYEYDNLYEWRAQTELADT